MSRLSRFWSALSRLQSTNDRAVERGALNSLFSPHACHVRSKGFQIRKLVNDYKAASGLQTLNQFFFFPFVRLQNMNMDDSFNYEMEDPNDTDGFEDSQDSELQQTQSTQPLSQQPPTNTDESHLWGYFQSCNDALFRIDFWKIHPRYTIGRHKELNQVVLPSQKISGWLIIPRLHLSILFIDAPYCQVILTQ